MTSASKTKDRTKGKGERVSRPLAGLAYWREFGDEFRSLGAGRYEVPKRGFQGGVEEVNIEREICSCDDFKPGKGCPDLYAVVIAISKPAPIPSRERFAFSADQVMANLDRMGA